jgi:hypothetical protein
MRPFRFMLCPVLGFSALLCSPEAFAAGNYTQNFATAPASWSVANDTWSAATGDYRNASGVIPPATAWYTGNSWTTNFTYKVRAYSEWPDTGNELGVVFGLTDSTHYFRVVLSMDGVVDLASVSGNPGAPTLIRSGSVTPASVGLAADTWFDLEVFVNGNTVTVKVNGKVAIAREPITPVAGSIGVIARANLARFDDLSITDNLATQLFRGTFTETDGTALNVSAPNIRCTANPQKNCYANITGEDQSGYSWPIRMWGDGDPALDDDDGAKLQYISRSSTGEVTDFVGAAVETRPGHVNMNPDGSGGNPTHVLHQWLIQMGENQPQVPYIIRPRNTFAQQHDLYMRFWLKYPDELTGYWQMPWQFKTYDSHTADSSDSLRVSLFATPNVSHNGTSCPGATAGQWHWLIQADPGVGTPGTLKWQQCNPTAEVPMGRWFKVEVFFHRATSATGTGRVWVAIDNNEILDYTVAGTPLENGMYAAGSPIDRIMLPQQYGGDEWPRDQYVDDLEIWNGFPANASDH